MPVQSVGIGISQEFSGLLRRIRVGSGESSEKASDTGRRATTVTGNPRRYCGAGTTMGEMFPPNKGMTCSSALFLVRATTAEVL